MDSRYFSDRIVEWYEQNHRKLLWRETRDPYRIWLSEIILQQTRVNQGLPYYVRFVEKYPTIRHLARAKEQEVLRLWQGLGYYTRARNLHKCAQKVVSEYNGKFPESFLEIKKLPGIGDYTAAAIASIAFDEPVAVVDGNVFRVLARVFNIEEDISTGRGKTHFFEKANRLIDPARPGLFNQAVMEFGALHCTPQQPGCNDCIFEHDCQANKMGLQHLLPVKTRSKASKKRYFYYFVIGDGNKFALKKRTEKDIWHGLYDFYLVEKSRPARVEKIVSEDLLLKKFSKDHFSSSPTYRHVLSHQTILAKFITVLPDKRKLEKVNTLQFFTKNRIHNLPKPILINKFLSDHKIL